MAEYIEREEAYNAIVRNYTVDDQLRELDAIPAADVRPVVLCKDCAHSRKGKESLECGKHRYAWNDRLRWVDDNDFCCWGVRKDGDGK